MQALLIAWLIATSPSTAPAQPRKLTLAEAVDLALQVDPQVAEARIGEDRTKLGVLRSQLDRVSLKVDGQLQELWAGSNIGGPRQCTTAATSDPTLCTQAGGQLVGAQQGGLGLLNVAANLNVPLFSGFRVSSNVARAKKLEELPRSPACGSSAWTPHWRWPVPTGTCAGSASSSRCSRRHSIACARRRRSRTPACSPASPLQSIGTARRPDACSRRRPSRT